MYFLVYGEDTYRARRKLSAMREQFRKTRDASGLNERILRVSDDAMEAVQEALFASPFLADRKLVILHGFLSANKTTQEKLADILPKKPDSTVAIFFEESDAKSLAKSALFEILKTRQYTEEYPALTPHTANRFVSECCTEEKTTIEPRAAQELIAMIGVDSWALRQECGKLAAYAAATGSPTVTIAMVHDMVNGERDESVFAFMDAATNGNPAEAMRLLERLIESGTAELQLIPMLSKQVRTILGAKDLMERGYRDKNDIARALGVHPFPAGKAMAAANRRSRKDLLALHDYLVEAECLLKTGGTRPNISIDLFAMRAAKK